MHAVRQFCASTWAEHEISIIAVARHLRHSEPEFMLPAYTPLYQIAIRVFATRSRISNSDFNHILVGTLIR